MGKLTNADDYAVTALVILVAQVLSGTSSPPDETAIQSAVTLIRHRHSKVMGLLGARVT